MDKKIISVIGSTGAQGKSVVEHLLSNGSFHVRALTRNPENYDGNAHEVVKADLDDKKVLLEAFKNSYAVFVVTNFWEGADETAQGKIAVEAAKEAGVTHFIWSTLPNVESISHGEFNVDPFTNKSKVDAAVSKADFKYHTFVQPPFYYQNFTGSMAPMSKEDGSTGWTLPIDPKKKVFHMGDINDLGKVVLGALLHPEKAGKGNYLSVSSELGSFNDILSAYKANGKDYSFTHVSGEVFSTFFEGADLFVNMLGFMEKYTYMGPNAQPKTNLAQEISTRPFLPLKEWIQQN